MHAHGHPGLHFSYIVAITIQFVEDHRLGDVKQQATAQRLCRDITAKKKRNYEEFRLLALGLF